MIDPRFTVTGRRDGSIVVQWNEEDRTIIASFTATGRLQQAKLLSLPARPANTPLPSSLSGIMAGRWVDPARPTYAAVLSTIREQWPAIRVEADRQRDAAVEAAAARAYKLECDVFVDRVNALSPVAAAWVLRRLQAGRSLESVQREITNRLEGIDG